VAVACAASQSSDLGEVNDNVPVAVVDTPTPVNTTTPSGDPAPGSMPVSSLEGVPRVVDWSESRVPGRSTRNVDPLAIVRANQVARGPEWNGVPTATIATGAPVTATPAVLGTSWVESSPLASDELFFGVNGTGSGVGITSGVGDGGTVYKNNNFFAFNSLYSTLPTLMWATTFTGGGPDRSGVAVSYDGTKIYVIDSGSSSGKATLHCLVATTGAKCSGWSDFQANGQVHGSSPWVNYLGYSGSYAGDVYFGDDASYVYHINGSTGSQVWAVRPGASGTYQSKFESSPVVLQNYVYIGDDIGQIFRLTDNGPPAAGQSTVAIFDTCSVNAQTAPCGSSGGAWSIRTALAFDVVNSHAYAVANNYVFELNGSTGNWATTATPKQLSATSNTTPMLSSPVIDNTNGFLYTAVNGTIYKVSYPFTGSATSGFTSSSLTNGGTGTSNPSVDPIPYNNYVYMGDTSGYTERYNCATHAGTPLLDGEFGSSSTGLPVNFGTLISSQGVLDYSTGNVNFGFTNSSAGGIVQYPLSQAVYCPSGLKACSSGTSTCSYSGGNYGDSCAACCTGTDCASGTCNNGVCAAACTGTGQGNCTSGGPHTTVACTSGVCVYGCATSIEADGGVGDGGAGSTNYQLCSGTYQTTGCTDVNSDINNCGGCGTVCSNNNIPEPICAAGTCGGHCADGFVHCTGTRQASGCETAATCGSCCGGSACLNGYTCYDTGSTGACVRAQTTQTYGTASEESTATVTCPTGQSITGVTFADFGTPNGTAGQSWSTTSACSTQTTSTTCAALNGCLWNTAIGSGVCVAYSCNSAGTSGACGALTGCTWTSGHGTDGVCIPTACSGLTQPNCPGSCLSFTTSGACAATSGCEWDSGQSQCIPVCGWDSNLGICGPALGYLHDYGTYSTTPTSSACALDVSGSSYVTGCVGDSTCNVNDTRGNFTPDNGCTENSNGTTYPLPTANCSQSSAYWDDPCQNVYKRVYLQMTCGTCPGTTKTVFVSTDKAQGSVTVAGADAFCAAEATAAGLSGTFLSWLSTTATSANSRNSHASVSYTLADGTVVATGGWSTLTSGSLTNKINEDANGNPVGTENVWTGTGTNGNNTGLQCTSWSSNAAGGSGGTATYGSTNSTGTGWTSSGTGNCNNSYAFYCIEQ
jgi:hypothetical protein